MEANMDQPHQPIFDGICSYYDDTIFYPLPGEKFWKFKARMWTLYREQLEILDLVEDLETD